MLNGMRVLESWWLTEPGEPCAEWLPCGGGWKKKRMFIPQVPYRGALQIDANTLMMHPVTLRELRASSATKGE